MQFPYGQNVAWGQNDFVHAMDMWFDEYKVTSYTSYFMEDYVIIY